MLNPFENAKGEASLQNHEVVGGNSFFEVVDSHMRDFNSKHSWLSGQTRCVK